MARMLSTALALTLLLPSGALAQGDPLAPGPAGCQPPGPDQDSVTSEGLVCTRPGTVALTGPAPPAPSPTGSVASSTTNVESAAGLDPMDVPIVSADTAVILIESGERVVIDVRTPAEYELAHVSGALNVDVSADDIEDRIAELDPDAAYLVYCRSGNRSAAAAALMAAMGLDVVDARGLVDLARAGAPIE